MYLKLNKIQTHLLTWGDPLNVKSSTDVIICITGNPGIVDFYTDFASELHDSTKLPVCVIGHAGHEEVPDLYSNELKGQEHLFNLTGQVNHKLDLINNHISKDCKIHFIGHSIGAWMILELLKKDKNLTERVSSVNFLFPTVQKMAKSKNGIFLNNIVRKIHVLVMLLLTILDILPVIVKNALLSLYMRFRPIPLHYARPFMIFLSYTVCEKVLFLAYDEMDTVDVLDVEIIEEIKDRSIVLYSSNDGWAPVHYMNDFKCFEPQLKLKQVNAEHAFVLKSSTEIANIVSDFIKIKVK